ncbi:MAG: 1-phosphofructokinase family hexose kinase [Planctomycetota bacterium]
MKSFSIVTVGICPSWDIICQVDGFQWGEHKRMVSEKRLCAGKALNISRAMAWLGLKSVATGLWGQDDYQLMKKNLQEFSDWVDVKFTPASGHTRQNVTVIEQLRGKSIHLRAPSELADNQSLKRLAADLQNIVDENSICVFAGALPEGALLTDCVCLIDQVRDSGAKIAVDTSGSALKRVLESGHVWLIKPNLEELRQLLGRDVEDNESAIVEAARQVCEKVELVVVSRGQQGAIAVTKKAAFSCRQIGAEINPVSTVGCGDYLLAGLLSGLAAGDIKSALTRGVKVAAARAWGLTETSGWGEVENKIEVEVCEIY